MKIGFIEYDINIFRNGLIPFNKRIKSMIQRIKYGYCSYDIHNLYSFLDTVLFNSLKDFKKTNRNDLNEMNDIIDASLSNLNRVKEIEKCLKEKKYNKDEKDDLLKQRKYHLLEAIIPILNNRDRLWTIDN